MKITDVEAMVLSLGSARNVADATQEVFLVVITTDSGLKGVGVADSSPWIMKTIVEAPRSHDKCCGLRELLIGEDPFKVEVLWERMYYNTYYYGRRGAAIAAISAIDIALWDIIGQSVGKPIYQLLGGPFRQKVKAYASCLFPEDPAHIDEVKLSARRWVDAGFKAIKFGWGCFGVDPDTDVELVKAARKEMGENTDLMIDVGMRWDSKTGIQRAKLLAPFKPFWIEEPLPPDDYRGYQRMAESIDFCWIVAGEEEYTLFGFHQLIEEGRVDAIQPDVTRAGGFTECRKIAALAKLRNIPVVPHCWSSDIAVLATLHFIGSLPNVPFLEYCVTDSPLRELTQNPPRVIDGYVGLPNRPGLGAECDYKKIERFRVA